MVLALLVLLWIPTASLAELIIPAGKLHVELSQLYDAKTGVFGVQKLLTRGDINTFNVTISRGRSITEHAIMRTTQDVYNTQQIEGEAQISVRMGMVGGGASASGSSLANRKTSTRTTTGYGYWYQEKAYTHIDFCVPEVINKINKKYLGSEGMTHVVVGIMYGGATEVLVKTENTDITRTSSLEVEVQLQLDYAFGKVSASARNAYYAQNGLSESKLTFIVTADANIPTNGSTPKSVDEIPKYLENMTSYLDHYNNGIGAPVRIYLRPVHEYEVCFDEDYELKKYANLPPSTIGEITKILNDIEEARLDINELEDNFRLFRRCLPTQRVIEAQDVIHDYKAHVFAFQNILAKDVVEVGNGYWPASSIEETINNFTASEFSPRKLMTLMNNNFSSIVSKLRFYQILNVHNIHCYQGLLSTPSLNLDKPYNKDTLVFWMRSAVLMDEHKYQSAMACLSHYCVGENARYKGQCYIADCDLYEKSCKFENDYQVKKTNEDLTYICDGFGQLWNI